MQGISFIGFFGLVLFGSVETRSTCGDASGPKCGNKFSKFQCGQGESCCHDSFNTWCCPANYKCHGKFHDPGDKTHCMTAAFHSRSCVYVPPPGHPKACPNPVKKKHGTVCECTGTSCGEYPDPSKLKAGEAMIITSSGNADGNFENLMVQEIIQGQTSHSGLSQMTMTVDSKQTFQVILGFGGAFTDAAASMYEQLDAGTKSMLVKQYFGKGGIGYSIGRVPMNAADFSKSNYAFTQPNDFELDTFCLRDDSSAQPACGTDYKATFIKDAQTAVTNNGDNLKLFVSTWSAPPWYKNQSFSCETKDGVDACSPVANGGDAMQCTRVVKDPSICTKNQQCEPCATSPYSLAGRLLQHAQAGAGAPSRSLDKSLCHKVKPSATNTITNANGNCYNTGFLRTVADIQDSWARYFSKFISAYKRKGIDVWGLTVQNEPLTQTGLWESMFYTAELEAEFVAKHLGPTIQKDHPGTKIMVHDDQTTTLLTFASKVLDDADAAKYIDGVGYHWYNSLEGSFENGPTGGFKYFGIDIDVGNLLNGGKDVQTIYDKLQAQNREKFVLATEACNGYALGTSWVGPRHGAWGYGYAYSHDILWQLKNSASGWTDWNLLLDENGGPNVAGNFVDSPMFKYDGDTAKFYQNPSFFHLAHFSKYIPAGSKRVDFSLDCGAMRSEFCQAVAFLTPSRQLVFVMTNDEITVGPIAGGGAGLGMAAMPWLARGQGSLKTGTKSLSWQIVCGDKSYSGTLPWKSIQTVVIQGDCTTNPSASLEWV